jgi:hypothetical protein
MKIKEIITLENAHTFSVPFSKHPLAWKFLEECGQLANEFQDQIIPLTPEAAKFLWDFMNTQRQLSSISSIGKYYNEQSELSCGENENQKVKKWLYERGIPFDRRVFWITQPQWGFILTWKMVIKFSENLFFGDNEVIWDKTLNWVLMFDHNDIFYFGKNRNFNTEKHSEEITIITKLVNESKKNNSL